MDVLLAAKNVRVEFGKLVAAVDRWGDTVDMEGDPIPSLLALYVRYHQEEADDPELVQAARDAFKELEEIEGGGKREKKSRGGVISFHHSDIHPHDIGTVLDRQGIAIRTGHHCTMPLMRSMDVVATARASFYIYNTEEEVDLLVDGLKQVLRYFADGDRRA